MVADGTTTEPARAAKRDQLALLAALVDAVERLIAERDDLRERLDHDEPADGSLAAIVDELARLRDAIRAHQAAIDPLEATDADLTLWSLVDQARTGP